MLSEPQEMFAPENDAAHPALSDIFGLWNERRALRRMPERADIAPRDMKAYLPFVQLFEPIDGGNDFRLRVMGTDFVETMGYDPTGQRLSELKDPTIRERTLSALRRVIETGTPVRTSAPFGATATAIYRKVERILLPLGVNGAVTHVLCKAVCIDQVKRLR